MRASSRLELGLIGPRAYETSNDLILDSGRHTAWHNIQDIRVLKRQVQRATHGPEKQATGEKTANTIHRRTPPGRLRLRTRTTSDRTIPALGHGGSAAAVPVLIASGGALLTPAPCGPSVPPASCPAKTRSSAGAVLASAVEEEYTFPSSPQ